MADPNISDVLIATRGPIYLDGTGYGVAEGKVALQPITREGPSKGPGETSPDVIFGQGLFETVRLLNASGRRVFYLPQVPELALAARDGLGRPLAWTHSVDDCVTERAVYETRMRRYRKILRTVEERLPYLRVIDVEDKFCDARACAARREQYLLYFDNNHLSVSGSQVVAPAIVEQILGPATTD